VDVEGIGEDFEGLCRLVSGSLEVFCDRLDHDAEGFGALHEGLQVWRKMAPAIMVFHAAHVHLDSNFTIRRKIENIDL
jgi:hypothetical protein